MSTYEILTIILTVFSGIVAVSAILVPIILNYKTRKAELKMNSPEEQDKLKYNEYRMKYMNLVDELSISFSNYLVSQIRDNKAAFISNIYKLKIISDHSLKNKLDDLLNEVQNETFDKNNLISLFNVYLQEIGEESFSNYWYGLHFFDNPHSDLIYYGNKKHSNKNK